MKITNHTFRLALISSMLFLLPCESLFAQLGDDQYYYEPYRETISVRLRVKDGLVVYNSRSKDKSPILTTNNGKVSIMHSTNGEMIKTPSELINQILEEGWGFVTSELTVSGKEDVFWFLFSRQRYNKIKVSQENSK